MSNRCTQLMSAAIVATLTSLAGIVYRPTAISNPTQWPPRLAQFAGIARPPPEPLFSRRLYTDALTHPSKVQWGILFNAPNPEKWVWLLPIIAVPAVIAILLLVAICNSLSRVPRVRQTITLLLRAATDPAEFAVSVIGYSIVASRKARGAIVLLLTTHLEHAIYLITIVLLLCIQCTGAQHRPFSWQEALSFPAAIWLTMFRSRDDKSILVTAMAITVLVGGAVVPLTAGISPGNAAFVVAGWWAVRLVLEGLAAKIFARSVQTKDAATSASQNASQV